MPKLVCQSGHNAGHEYPLTKDVTILGRQSSCDVQVQDEMSSRAHCQLRRDGRLYSLVDLGSRNGTLLNNKKVSERLLAFGDVIRIGKAEYLLVKESGDLELKDLLSKYEILEKIGEGGMGIVYKANQRSMARIVALKILSPKYSSKRKFVEQFTREARAAGSLNHPNIIQVHDVGTENDIHYFSMEFVDGPTCMQVLKSQGEFPVPDAMEIIRQTARALEYAHAHRLIHQDIKPDNIMVGPNNIVKLADLGISKTFDEAEDESGSKKVMGTPHYMAPEAALGKKVDQRVDIYSLGATAYHLLSGRTPYSGSSPTEVLKQHVMDPLPPITEINPDIPPKVVALIEKMMAKKPDDRQQSAAEVLEDIRLSVGSESTNERAPGGETLILRRYAKGGPAAASVPTPASLTTGGRTTPGGDMTTPGEGSNKVGKDRNLRLLNRGLAIGIGVAAVACSLVLLKTCMNNKGPGDDAPPPAAVTPSVVAPVPAVVSAADLAQQRHDTDAKALSALDDELNQDHPDTRQMLSELERITNDPSHDLDAENLSHAKDLRVKIADLIARHRTEQVMGEFDKLSEDVRKLSDDHDYDTALSRLDAFNDRHEPEVKDGFDKLRAAIDQEKSNFRTDLLTRINSARISKDSARLKELRDSLPPPFLNTDIEQTIESAMAAVNEERQKDQAPLLAKAAKALCEWNFSEFDDQWTNNRPAMDGNAAQQFDGYHDIEVKLLAMISAISQRLKGAHIIRFDGTLHGMDSPDLQDAVPDQGLELTMSNSGTVLLRWNTLTVNEFSAVITAVLGREAVGTYKGALTSLDSLKQSLAAPK